MNLPITNYKSFSNITDNTLCNKDFNEFFAYYKENNLTIHFKRIRFRPEGIVISFNGNLLNHTF